MQVRVQVQMQVQCGPARLTNLSIEQAMLAQLHVVVGGSFVGTRMINRMTRISQILKDIGQS